MLPDWRATQITGTQKASTQFHPIPEVYHTPTGLPAWPPPTRTPSRLAAVAYLSFRQLHGYWDSPTVPVVFPYRKGLFLRQRFWARGRMGFSLEYSIAEGGWNGKRVNFEEYLQLPLLLQVAQQRPAALRHILIGGVKIAGIPRVGDVPVRSREGQELVHLSLRVPL